MKKNRFKIRKLIFHKLGSDLRMGLGLPWTANRFALFNYSKTDEGIDGIADFNWFRFTNK